MHTRDWLWFVVGALGMAMVAVACLPVTKTALDVIAPIAADALTDLIAERFGGDTAEDTAGCFPLPDGFNDDGEGYVYILCRARPVE